MKRIYLYLFIFSFAINVFQFTNDSKMLEEKENTIEKLKKKVEKQNDSILILNNQLKQNLPS